MLLVVLVGAVDDVEKQRASTRKTEKLYLRAKKERCPYMGVALFRKLEQVSDFSTFHIGYPQYLGSYPQYSRTGL